jgi:hypothetical protein
MKKSASATTNGPSGATPANTRAGECYPKITHRFIHRGTSSLGLSSPKHRTILYLHRAKHLHVGFSRNKRHKHICTRKVQTENINSADECAYCRRSGNRAARPPPGTHCPADTKNRCRALAHEPLDIVVAAKADTRLLSQEGALVVPSLPSLQVPCARLCGQRMALLKWDERRARHSIASN